ncbi:MAG: hypothetical protein ABI837_07560, partial [Acidobacteriota bacterium]
AGGEHKAPLRLGKTTTARWHGFDDCNAALRRRPQAACMVWPTLDDGKLAGVASIYVERS